ncbi:MAG TPA: LamG domain-containing protein, partial [Saprospiraceae bacterium]|nr:LamG domain-containing protein [Saprospiraceae bacterium]
RIYHHKLDELDFDQIMEGTTSSETPYLTHYWKMDEELGVKSYDIVSRQKLYFCGAVFDPDRPPVHTAGITNADGYYMIESASYGTGTTFLAKPMKNFYMHRSLKFEKADNDYATLPDFSITAKATIELWVNSAGPDGAQCVLSKKWGGKEFRLILNPSGLDNQIRINLNGTSYDYGLLGSGFQHLAFTWDSLSRTMAAYKNGILLGTSTFPLTVSGNWSDPTNDPWYLGKRFDGTQPFGGLIDEVAVYDTILSPAIIMDHFQNPRDMQEAGLRVYFPMDEGSGNKISNVGSVLLNGGITTGTEWSPLAAHQVVEPHVFTPGTSQVTLNPSVTSVDQVNFTDRSTIAVSGYVRYKNTDCFANNVEILVNGTSFSPKVITDSTGKFVIDFDPGTSAILTPVFKDHVFVPASWEVTNLSSPIAGILFTDLTTRKITGKVTGGECHKSIIHIIQPPGDVSQSTVCIVKVSSVDGCLERQIQIHNPQGNFEFDNLPPLEKMTVAVVEHSDPLIKEAFQTSGGSTVDLSKRDTLIDFIYTAPPQVEIVSGLDPVSLTCDKIVLDQFELDSLRIKLTEHYLGGDCYLDTANFHIINGSADEVVDSTMSDSMLTYRFRVSGPNPSPPFLKTLQIIGTTPEDREASLTVQAIVTGILAKENTFTTALPETPTLILHDPPGDGSYAYLEKNNKVCQQIAFNKEVTAGAGATTILDLGPDIKIPTFFGIPDVEWNSEIGPTLTATTTMTKVQENAVEVCTSFDQRISTSEDDIVVGGAQGGDVYVGGGLNINFGFADVVFFDEGS